MSGSQSQGGGEDTLASAVLLLIQAQAKQADAAEKAANQRAELLKVQKDEAKRKADGAAAKEGDRLAAAAQVTEDADVKLRKRLRDTLSERCVRADAVAEQRRRVLDFRQSVEGPVALVQQQTANGEWSPVFQVLLNTLPAQLVLDIQKRKRRGRWNRRRTARSSGGGSRGGAQSPTQQQQRA